MDALPIMLSLLTIELLLPIKIIVKNLFGTNAIFNTSFIDKTDPC